MLVYGACSVAIFDARRVSTVRDALAAQAVRAALDVAHSPNLLTTSGLQNIGLALNWALIQTAQASNWTTAPFSSAQGNLGDCYAAVGSSTTAVLATDTILGSETGRSIVSVASTSAGPVITLNALLTSSQANGSILEAGWFTGATSASGSGTLLDHTILATSISKSSTSTALLTLTLTLSSG